MSLIKTIKAQLGLSVTPANNFTLDASADNGTMLLERGNGQDIMTVDAAGKVAFPQNAQTWQNLTGSRALATTYTNSTGNDIVVNVVVLSNAAGEVAISIGAVSVFGSTGIAAGASSLIVTVPAGATYTATRSGTATLNYWAELR